MAGFPHYPLHPRPAHCRPVLGAFESCSTSS